MVSLVSENIGLYVERNTGSSLLLKSFSSYLFDDFRSVSKEELEQFSQNKKDYKYVAALGYLVNHQPEFLDFFCSGLTWMIGRNISSTDSIIYDNPALLGICIGLNSIQQDDLVKLVQIWLDKILSQKQNHSAQIAYSVFFKQLLKKDFSLQEKSALENELNIFGHFVLEQKPQSSSLVAEYFQKIRVSNFPYYENDFFRNLINIYNTNQILKNYILSAEDFDKKINSATQNERENTLSFIKKKLDDRAKGFTDWFFGIYVFVLLITFATIVLFISLGDWDFYEPKTYLLGLPLLSYIILSIYSWITDKELSLKPKSIIDKIFQWKQKRIYKEFGIELSKPQAGK